MINSGQAAMGQNASMCGSVWMLIETEQLWAGRDGTGNRYTQLDGEDEKMGKESAECQS